MENFAYCVHCQQAEYFDWINGGWRCRICGTVLHYWWECDTIVAQA